MAGEAAEPGSREFTVARSLARTALAFRRWMSVGRSLAVLFLLAAVRDQSALMCPTAWGKVLNKLSSHKNTGILSAEEDIQQAGREI